MGFDGPEYFWDILRFSDDGFSYILKDYVSSDGFWRVLKGSEGFWRVLKGFEDFLGLLMSPEYFWDILRFFDWFWYILKSSGKFFLDWFNTRGCYENLLNFLPYCTSCTVKIQSTIQDLFNKYLAFLRGKRRENVNGNWTCQPRLKNESEVEIN